MRLLVTGGGGFIGSAVVRLALAAGHEVRVVDRDPRFALPGVELIRADLNHPGVAEAAVAGVDAVCHQAARVGLGLSYADAPDYVTDNDRATAVLLAALAARGFTGRLVLASSMVVYGEGRYRCRVHGLVRPGPRRVADLDAGRFEPPCPHCDAFLDWESVPEDAPLDPRSVYAATKVAQEHLCACFARETGACAVALRYHNVYGPGLPSDTPYAGVAALFRSWLQRGEPAQVYEDGGQQRDFVHVQDVARANLAALEAELADGTAHPFNVCSGTPVTIGAVAAAMSAAFGPHIPAPVVTGRYRLGDVRHIVASPERAAAELGFRARIALADGVGDLLGEQPANLGAPA
jgi:dTDP-L-rhamnose 4-epimerase